MNDKLNKELQKLLDEYRASIKEEVRKEILTEQQKYKEDHEKYCHPNCPEQQEK